MGLQDGTKGVARQKPAEGKRERAGNGAGKGLKLTPQRAPVALTADDRRVVYSVLDDWAQVIAQDPQEGARLVRSHWDFSADKGDMKTWLDSRLSLRQQFAGALKALEGLEAGDRRALLSQVEARTREVKEEIPRVALESLSGALRQAAQEVDRPREAARP